MSLSLQSHQMEIQKKHPKKQPFEVKFGQKSDLNGKVHEAFKREYSCGIINLGSVCNLSCFYCSQYFNPPDLVLNQNRFLTMDEIKYFLGLVSNKIITKLGSSTWVNAGEFFGHPHSFEVLEYIRDNGFVIKSALSTNGMLIEKHHVKVIKEIGIEVELHLCNYSKTKDTLNLLDKYQVSYTICIVPTHTSIDNKQIENWVKKLQIHNPIRIRILKPGYTKYTPLKRAKQMDISNAELIFLIEKWQKCYPNIKITFQTGNLHAASILRSIYFFSSNYQNHTNVSDPETLFLIAESVKDIFKPIVKTFTSIDNLPITDYKIVPVKNRTFGGNCDISGLLLIEDYISAIEETIEKGYIPEFIVLPKGSFTYDNSDLNGASPLVIRDKFNVPIMWC
jgi:hypothetical protein|tara:strand:+ start:688 stop:1866 length:1179 start_codon:yes stop_codon:yes gene_type:complete